MLLVVVMLIMLRLTQGLLGDEIGDGGFGDDSFGGDGSGDDIFGDDGCGDDSNLAASRLMARVSQRPDPENLNI